MIRVRAGISYALTEAMDDGHCGLPTEELVPLAVELLEISKELVQTALDLELSEGTVIAATAGETACVFPGGLYRAEQVIAERIVRIASGKLPWSYIDPEKALPWVEKKTGLSLAESQVAAIRLALISKILVITGGPGVGKTTIVKTILRVLAAKGVNLLLCAPTGRAAKRMTEATGFEAKTIHRLLEVDPKAGGFKRNSENPLECDLLIVDETSMVDVMLMQALMKAAPDNAALLIVGDIDQLPSVGPGQILADVIASGAMPVIRLTEVFRQAAQSRIITSAHRINQGSIPDRRADPPRQLSRKLLSTLDRLGCLSFRSAFASICRMRSRVTENFRPTSSSVWSLFMPMPKRMRKIRSSRGVSDASTRVVVSRRFDWIAASIGRIPFLSSMKSPRWESSSSPIGVSSDSGSLAVLRALRTFSSGMRSFSASSSGVGSRPISLSICRLVRTILLIISITCTGTRMVRD